MSAKVRRPRQRFTSTAIGAIGYLFGSPATARVLDLFTSTPDAHYALGEIVQRAGGAKATIQAALRTLVLAGLVKREGRGSATTYSYAMDRELAQGMLRVVRLSRQSQSPVGADMPWLTRLVQETPRTVVVQPFGHRLEGMPSESGTIEVLAASPPIPEAMVPRNRPGLPSRR